MPPTPSHTDERLRDCIAMRMRMSHIYQPLMLMELLGRRSAAPAVGISRRWSGSILLHLKLASIQLSWWWAPDRR